PTGSGTITAAFSRVEAHNNPASAGIYINSTSASGGSITALATDCVSVGNGFGYAVATRGLSTILTVAHSAAYGNLNGLYADGANGILRIAGSTVTDNPLTGWKIFNNATIETLGDNTIRGNGGNVGGSLTPVPKQ